MATTGDRFQGLSFELEYPHSVGLYDKYEDAQKAVDFLADAKFPVQNLAIVGTNLKLVERVTGRKNWGSVIRSSIITGISTGLVVGILLGLFSPDQFVPMVLAAVVIGIVVNIIFGALTYSMAGGKRDFNSIRSTIPSNYEILCEHKFVAEARAKLLEMPGNRASAFE